MSHVPTPGGLGVPGNGLRQEEAPPVSVRATIPPSGHWSFEHVVGLLLTVNASAPETTVLRLPRPSVQSWSRLPQARGSEGSGERRERNFA